MVLGDQGDLGALCPPGARGVRQVLEGPWILGSQMGPSPLRPLVVPQDQVALESQASLLCLEVRLCPSPPEDLLDLALQAPPELAWPPSVMRCLRFPVGDDVTWMWEPSAAGSLSPGS